MRLLVLWFAMTLVAATPLGRPMERQIIGVEQDHSLETESGN
jgi:hypothetical protein